MEHREAKDKVEHRTSRG